MIVDLSKANWRKTTDIYREYAVFELVQDGVILLDVGFSDDEIFQVAFHEGISNAVVDCENFLEVLKSGRKVAESDK